MAYPFPPMLGTDPLRLLIGSVVRKAPRSLGAHVKSLNYLDAIVAKQQAKAAGLDDAVMLDALGAVAECTSTNLFMVVDGVLVTPTTRAALPGITRRTVLELASELDIAVEERDIWPMELYVADAIFLTGSGAGIVPVGAVDGRPVATSEHPYPATLTTCVPRANPGRALSRAGSRCVADGSAQDSGRTSERTAAAIWAGPGNVASSRSFWYGIGCDGAPIRVTGASRSQKQCSAMWAATSEP